MSDYISRSALEKYLQDYKWEFALGSDFSKAIEMVDVQPTVDEKEIIRKPMERIVEQLTESKEHYRRLWNKNQDDEDYGALSAYEDAINTIKEEGGIE